MMDAFMEMLNMQQFPQQSPPTPSLTPPLEMGGLSGLVDVREVPQPQVQQQQQQQQQQVVGVVDAPVTPPPATTTLATPTASVPAKKKRKSPSSSTCLESISKKSKKQANSNNSPLSPPLSPTHEPNTSPPQAAAAAAPCSTSPVALDPHLHVLKIILNKRTNSETSQPLLPGVAERQSRESKVVSSMVLRGIDQERVKDVLKQLKMERERCKSRRGRKRKDGTLKEVPEVVEVDDETIEEEMGEDNKPFPSLHSVKSHLKCHAQASLACPTCGLTFRRNHDLVRHVRTMHDAPKPHTCEACGKGFARADALRRHKTTKSVFRCPNLPRPGKEDEGQQQANVVVGEELGGGVMEI
ncbi:hypothetical protein HDV05_005427 [Chytridiales sp. JEL 0842]|nr:hypothetical protein HDV05_005427 [Chytridiales sp. JEL 0842]